MRLIIAGNLIFRLHNYIYFNTPFQLKIPSSDDHRVNFTISGIGPGETEIVMNTTSDEIVK